MSLLLFANSGIRGRVGAQYARCGLASVILLEGVDWMRMAEQARRMHFNGVAEWKREKGCERRGTLANFKDEEEEKRREEKTKTKDDPP